MKNVDPVVELEVFEKRTGMILPEALKRIVRDPPILEVWAVADPKDITDLVVLEDPVHAFSQYSLYDKPLGRVRGLLFPSASTPSPHYVPVCRGSVSNDN